MPTSGNSYLIEDDHKILSIKRVITVSSDDEDIEMNQNNKRQRSSSLPKVKPLQLMNKQPVIRNTRQTSLSIIRTNSNEERKWNLKTIASSSNENSSKPQKKKMTQTVNKINLPIRPSFERYDLNSLYLNAILK
jgi:hypothetical protein